MPWFLQPVYLWHTPFSPAPPPPGGGPFHFFQYEVTVGIISVDGFESRFALACQPKGTCKEEIHRLFTAKHINPRTFSDCTDLDSTMYYRLQNEAEQPKLSTIVSLCVGFSLGHADRLSPDRTSRIYFAPQKHPTPYLCVFHREQPKPDNL